MRACVHCQKLLLFLPLHLALLPHLVGSRGSPCKEPEVLGCLPQIPCSIQRDVSMRGRDVSGVIEQYTKSVKPAFDQYVAPSRKFADVIIPWAR